MNPHRYSHIYCSFFYHFIWLTINQMQFSIFSNKNFSFNSLSFVCKFQYFINIMNCIGMSLNISFELFVLKLYNTVSNNGIAQFEIFQYKNTKKYFFFLHLYNMNVFIVFTRTNIYYVPIAMNCWDMGSEAHHKTFFLYFFVSTEKNQNCS